MILLTGRAARFVLLKGVAAGADDARSATP